MLIRRDDERLKNLDIEEFEWREITEDEYFDWLNVLPPIFHTSKGFMLSERYTENVTRCVLSIKDKYYTAHVDFTGIKGMVIDAFYAKLTSSDEFKEVYND